MTIKWAKCFVILRRVGIHSSLEGCSRPMLSTSFLFILLTNPSRHIKWWITPFHFYSGFKAIWSRPDPLLQEYNSFSWRLSRRVTAEELNLSPKQLFALSSDTDSLLNDFHLLGSRFLPIYTEQRKTILMSHSIARVTL